MQCLKVWLSQSVRSHSGLRTQCSNALKAMGFTGFRCPPVVEVSKVPSLSEPDMGVSNNFGYLVRGSYDKDQIVFGGIF